MNEYLEEFTRSSDDISNVHSSNEDQVDNFTLIKAEELRKKLIYYFMNPIQKWKAKGKFPWKLFLQILKIIIVTIHIILQGINGHKYQLQRYDSEVTFRHIFLKNWDSVRDIVTYPPSTGPYAAYTKKEFYQSLNYAIRQYAFFTEINVGTYGYDTPDDSLGTFKFCLESFKFVKASPHNVSLQFDDTKIETCFNITPLYPKNDERWKTDFRIQDFLQNQSAAINFNSLIRAKLHFYLQAIYIRKITTFNTPDCFKIKIVITYDNSQHESNIPVTLISYNKKLPCNYITDDQDKDYFQEVFIVVLDSLVITICSLSFFLCFRSLWTGQKLRKETCLFFINYRKKKLLFEDYLMFIDFWYIMIMVNDMLIISGTIIKIQMEKKTLEGDLHTKCSVLLGLGAILVFAGLLRYLGFFPKYNILIRTIKRGLPNILRFMLCAFLLYGGFCICGWVVLGPYHIKFASLSTASECLFAMMNGDDLYATFAIIDTNSQLIWWFSRIFLYTFISLFIYIVISLFIAVIMDAHDTVKHFQEGSNALSQLEQFICEGEFPSYESYREEQSSSCFKWIYKKIQLLRGNRQL